MTKPTNQEQAAAAETPMPQPPQEDTSSEAQSAEEEPTREQIADQLKLRERHQRDRQQTIAYFIEQLTAMERTHRRERESLEEMHAAERRERWRQAMEQAAITRSSEKSRDRKH